MASKGDLDLKITADASEVTTAMAETRNQLDQTITTINIQDQTWKSLAVAVVESTQAIAPSVAQITTAVAGLAGTIAVINHQKSMIAAVMSPLTSLGSAFVSYGGMAAKAVGLIAPQWKLITTAISVSLLVYKAATSEMAESAYKAAKGNADIEASTGRLQTAVGGLGTALAAPFGTAVQGAQSLVDAINPFPYLFGKVTETASGWIDSAASGIESLTPKVVAFGDVLSTVAFVTSSLGTATADSTAAFYEEAAALRASAAAAEIRLAAQEAQRPLFKQLGEMQDSARESAQRTEEAAKLGSLNPVAAIDEEIRALRAKAAQSILTGDAVKQSQQAATLQNTAKELKFKADAPKASADDKKAYADAQASADAYTKPLEEAAKHQARLFSILEDRKSGIESGRIKPPESSVASAIKSAEMATLALAQGQDAVTIATERAKGATEEELSVLSEKLEQAKQLKASQEESKAIADLIKKAADDEAATQQRAATQIAGLTNKIDLLNGSATQAEIALRDLASQGFTTEQAETIAGLNTEVEKLAQQKTATDKVNSLIDQIDLLSGAANEAQIAMRELGRAGFTDDQIAEIGALTDQLNALKESQKKQPKEKAEKDDSPKVALQGSKEAAEIMLRGVGGGNKIEEIGQKQLTEQQKMVSLLSKSPANPAMPQRAQEPQRLLPLNQPSAPIIQKPPSPVFTPNITLPELAAPEPVAEKPIQSLPIESHNAKPIPNLTPLVPRSVIPANPTPMQQIAQPEITASGSDFGGGALDYSESPSPTEALKSAVSDAIDAGKSHQEAVSAGFDAYKAHQSQQPAPIPVEPSSSGTMESVARPVVSPIEIPSPEMNVPPTPDVAIPSPPPMPTRWEQNALEVQHSLVADLANGPRLSAADNNVPIDRAAFPETSFKPNIKPIDVKTPGVAAIDIPSPVVNIPEQSQIAIPQPIVTPPTMPQLSVAAPEIQTESPSPVTVPPPVVSAPQQSRISIPAPVVDPVNVAAPLVNSPTMSPIAIEPPQVMSPPTPAIAIPSPTVTVPNVAPINVPSPEVSVPAETPQATRELAPPVVSIAPLPPMTIPAPEIAYNKTEPITSEPVSEETLSRLKTSRTSSAVDMAPLVTSASQQLAETQAMTATISRLTLATPDVTTNVAVPQAKNTFTPQVNVPDMPTPQIQSPAVNVDIAASPSPKVSMPELKIPKTKSDDIDRLSGLSRRSERGTKTEGVVDTKPLEKFADRQLATLIKIEAAVRANKPQQLAAGNV